MKVEQNASNSDRVKWFFVLLIIVSGIAANQYYSNQFFFLRMGIGLVLVGLAIFISLRTKKGLRAIFYLRESITELRKVAWPTRQETIQTTLIVVVMVVVAAFFLWSIDSILLWLIGLITGQKG